MINKQSHAFSSNFGYNCTASTIIPKLDLNACDYIYIYIKLNTLFSVHV